MILHNQNALHVFWRAFAESDTLHAIGLRDGWVAPGTRTDLYDHPSGRFQMEFRSGAPWHPFLKRAGEVYRNDDELFVTPDGQVLKLEQALSVERDPGERREIAGTVSNFFDRLAFDADATEEVTTTISTVVTTSGSVASKVTSGSGSETGGAAGGEVTGKGTFKGIEVGVKFNGSVSSKVSQATSQELATSHGISSVQTTGSTRKMPLPMRGRTITAIHWVWERIFVTGRTRVAGQVHEWEVTTRLEVSYRLEQYDSIAAMPPAVFDAYREKYPGTGLSLLRPGASLLVDGNGWIGLLRITRVQSDGSIEGSVYDQPLSGRWDAATGLFRFTRTIHPSYLQRWEVRVVSDRDMQGRFTEEVNGQPQPTRYPCRLTGTLAVLGNGHAGELRIDDIQADGSLTGRIYGDPLSGRWDQATGRLSFLRSSANTGYAQEWTGQRTGPLAFGGTFQERIGGQTAPGVYGWSAQP